MVKQVFIFRADVQRVVDELRLVAESRHRQLVNNFIC